MTSTRLWTVGLLAAGLMLAAAGQAQAAMKVWTVTGTQRVLREEPAPGKPILAVQLSAARNEWETFQILVRSDKPVGGVSLDPGTLRGKDGSEVPALLSQIYRMHHMRIDKGSYRNDAFIAGNYPDPLVPFTNSLTRETLEGGRIRSAPLDLPPDQTHGFLVDLYVPADTQPGLYKGAYHITTTEGQTVEIPVSLTVWDFELPRVSALVTSFGSPAGRLRAYYKAQAAKGKEREPARWGLVEAQVDDLLSKHRFNVEPPSRLIQPVEKDGAFLFTSDQVDGLRAFVDRQHVNAIRVPHPKSAVKDPVAQKARLHAWLKAFDKLAEAVGNTSIVYYTYLLDEPNDPAAYDYVRLWGKAIREARSQVKVMVVEQPDTQDKAWGDLYGAVDIWCPLFALFVPEAVKQRQDAGETIWTYTALCQGKTPTPWWQIDFPLLNYRVPAWIAWRYRIRGLLYWGGMSYWDQVEDPWNEAWTYGRPRDGHGKGNVFNGEGVLVYPGRAVGYDGIAPSLRLKALRDGIEDYDYLAILERLGRAAEAEQIVLPLAESWTKWEKDPAACQKARQALAELILKGRK